MLSLKYHKEEDFWKATPGPEGRWVKHSTLLRFSHMDAHGYGSFETVIDTMIEREEVMKREGRYYYKDSNGKETYRDTIFYSLKNK